MFAFVKLYSPEAKPSAFISFLPPNPQEQYLPPTHFLHLFIVAVGNLKQKTAIQKRSSIMHLQFIDIWFTSKPDVNVDATHQKDSYATDNKSSQVPKLNNSITTGTKLFSKHSWYSACSPALVQNKGRTVLTQLYLHFLSAS